MFFFYFYFYFSCSIFFHFFFRVPNVLYYCHYHVFFVFQMFCFRVPNGFDFWGLKNYFSKVISFNLSIFIPSSPPNPHLSLAKKIPTQYLFQGSKDPKPNSIANRLGQIWRAHQRTVMLGGQLVHFVAGCNWPFHLKPMDPYTINDSLEGWTMNPSKKAAVCLVFLCPNPQKTQQGCLFFQNLSWHGLFTHIYCSKDQPIWYLKYTSPMGWLVNRRKTFIPQSVTSYPPWN